MDANAVTNLQKLEQNADLLNDGSAQEVIAMLDAMAAHPAIGDLDETAQTKVRNVLVELIKTSTVMQDASQNRIANSRDLACRLANIQAILKCSSGKDEKGEDCDPKQIDCDNLSFDLDTLKTQMEITMKQVEILYKSKNNLQETIEDLRARQLVMTQQMADFKRQQAEMKAQHDANQVALLANYDHLKREYIFAREQLASVLKTQEDMMFVNRGIKALMDTHDKYKAYMKTKMAKMYDLIRQLDAPLAQSLRYPRLYLAFTLQMFNVLAVLKLLNESMFSRIVYELVINLTNSSLPLIAYPSRLIAPLYLRYTGLSGFVSNSAAITNLVGQSFAEAIVSDGWVRLLTATTAQALPLMISTTLIYLFGHAKFSGMTSTSLVDNIPARQLFLTATTKVLLHTFETTTGITIPAVNVSTILGKVFDLATRGSRYAITGEGLQVTSRLAGGLETGIVTPLYAFTFLMTWKSMRWALQKSGRPETMQTNIATLLAAISIFSLIIILHLYTTNNLFDTNIDQPFLQQTLSGFVAPADTPLVEVAQTIFEPESVVAPIVHQAIDTIDTTTQLADGAMVIVSFLKGIVTGAGDLLTNTFLF